MRTFDVQRDPLQGMNLIEAAAGTGKTYSIEHLFVRLILEKQIRVDEILTVTFTQAASAELRERIHARLLGVRNSLTRGSETLSPAGKPLNENSARLIGRALVDFDRAAIFTIHGFCQRLLHEHAFETGNTFDSELIPDQALILRQVAEDFWRLNVSGAPPELIAYFLDRLGGPERLVSFLARIKTPVFRLVPQTTEMPLQHLGSYREALTRLRNEWPSMQAEAMALLKEAALNAAVYGSLTPSAPEGSLTQREVRLAALQEALEIFLARQPTVFPPLAGLQKLTSAYLAQKTHRHREPPRHPLFDLCQTALSEARALEEEMTAYLRHFKTRLIRYAHSELRRRKRERNVQSFDDLLLAVSRALSSPRGNALAAAVRDRYRAVLVDEFQDTDDLQYSIFSRLFDNEQSCLFWIGDPKQAIYGFRGADIFSYLKAARSADSRYTLTENRRAIPELVKAVNTIFSHRKAPFLFPDIAFAPASAARDCDGSGASALTIWYLDSRSLGGDGSPVTRAEAEPFIARAVSAEIQRLLGPDGPCIPPGDMAVLVRTNDQARIVKQHLSGAGIPAVVCSTGSIFEAHEASELQRIMVSISEPTDSARLRAALATDILGAKADELARHDPDSDWWQIRYTRQQSYFERWQRDGFIAMFRSLVAEEGVKARLLSFADGERRLTNLLHLAELLHQASGRGSLGMAGLIRWLAAQRDVPSPRLEEHQLRLESDERAVKIVTVHKSKGLEYRVVFCPYAWSASRIGDEEVFFHDPAEDFRLTIDLSSHGGSPSRAAAENEVLSENLRLLYVALTRAKEHCYLTWGRINTAETSSMAYLFHYPEAVDRGIEDTASSVAGRLRRVMKSKTDEDLVDDLKCLAKRSAGSISVRSLPQSVPAGPRPRAGAGQGDLSCRLFQATIDRSWRTASYSMLVAGSSRSDEGLDRDAAFLQGSVEPEVSHPGAAMRRDMFAFPAGSRAGTFFHAVLEEVDFCLGRHPDNDAVIDRKLSEFGYDGAWRDTVSRMIAEVASAPIFGGAAGLTLERVPREACIHEMEFYYPLKPVSPRLLRDLFGRFGAREGIRGFPERLGRLAFAPMRGFMKGYIDLVVCQEGRFFLIDWKSNHLGDGVEHYHVRRLAESMRNELYILQYYIYTLALHLFLRRRVAGYDYQQHFGGVGYVFIRGIDRSLGPEFGIYTDRPKLDIIRAFEEALTGC